MLEERTDLGGAALQVAYVRGDLVAQRRLRAGRAALGDCLLEIVVEQLVRVRVGGVGRQIGRIQVVVATL